MTAVQGLLWLLPDVNGHHPTLKHGRVDAVTTPIKRAWQRIIVADHDTKSPSELRRALSRISDPTVD